jgi:NhaP-type Na+/H+ and K+/H+ antiporter
MAMAYRNLLGLGAVVGGLVDTIFGVEALVRIPFDDGEFARCHSMSNFDLNLTLQFPGDFHTTTSFNVSFLAAGVPELEIASYGVMAAFEAD